jgi:hypothetical protein
MELDLGTEEREILNVVRRTAERIGMSAPPAKCWEALDELGFLDVAVTNGAAGLHAACIAEALGEALAPISFAAYMTCQSVLGTSDNESSAAVSASAADQAWRAREIGAFGVGHQLTPGVAVVELLGEELQFALIHRPEGWLILEASQCDVQGPDPWAGAPGLAQVSWDVVKVVGVTVPLGDRDWNQLNVLLHTAELVGVMRESLRRTIEYLHQREQFGHPIGSFQAIQHRTVDIVGDLRACEALEEYAIWTWADSKPGSPEAQAWVHAAAGLVAEASVKLLRECFQFHGGIAMTAELWVHHWLRRASRLAIYQGGPSMHFAALGESLKRGVPLEVPLARTLG